MNPTREELAAFADGELTGETLSRVAAAVEADPALAAEVEAHRTLKARLSDHFAPVAAQPVPDRLTDLVTGGVKEDATIIDFASAAQTRKSRHAPRMQTWMRWAAPAVAAALVLAVMLRSPAGSPSNYASGATAEALETQLAAAQTRPQFVRVIMTFPNAQGELCRAYASPDQSGIACRDRAGWRLDRRFPGVREQSAEYRQAGSASAELMAAMQDLSAGAPLDAQGEAEARERDWRR